MPTGGKFFSSRHVGDMMQTS